MIVRTLKGCQTSCTLFRVRCSFDSNRWSATTGYYLSRLRREALFALRAHCGQDVRAPSKIHPLTQVVLTSSGRSPTALVYGLTRKGCKA
jgi:hypothetical protein